jgi:hypothetical protein
MLPFTAEQFFSIFEAYNRAIWPIPLAAYGLGLAAILAAMRPSPLASRFIALVLAIFWLWNGVAYHHGYLSAINPAAHGFGALFVAHGLLLLWAGVVRAHLRFDLRRGLSPAAGVALVAYAMLVYPILGHMAGHGWPHAPMFGVAPCPTTIFTIGLLLLAAPRPPWAVTVVPLLWAVIGGSAAILLDVPEDLGLWAAALIAILVLLHERRSNPATHA